MALIDKLNAIGDSIRVQSGKTAKMTLDQMPTEILDLQSLNFEVVGGTSAPASPKENTIWVRNPNLLNFKTWAANIGVSNGTKSYTENSITLTASENDCYTHYIDEHSKIPVTPGKTYVLSWEHTGANGLVYLFPNATGKGQVQTNANNNKLEITIAEGISFVSFRVGVSSKGNSATYSNIRIEEKEVEITGWHFGPDEPNVYDIQPKAPGDPWLLEVPIELSEGDILNFTIPATVPSTFEAIRIRDITRKMYCIRDWDASALTAWPVGAKVGVRISNDVNGIGSWYGDGTAYIKAWNKYYHEEGTLWLQTGTSSPVEFNALKKNSIQVCPISAKQYVGGAWVDKEAKTYQVGAWVDWWNGELFQNGNQYTAITGGWSESGYYYYSSNYQTVAPTIGNTIKLTANGSTQCCVAGTQKAVDLTNAKTLYLDVLSTVGSCYVCIVDSQKNVYSDKWIAGRTLATGTTALDVASVSGSVYIAVFAVGGDNATNTAEVNNIRWE